MGWTLDFTGPQMILTIKLMSFAFNYYDGVVDIDTINSYPDDKVTWATLAGDADATHGPGS